MLGVGYFISQSFKSINLGFIFPIKFLSPLECSFFGHCSCAAMKGVIIIQCLFYSYSDFRAELAVKQNRDFPNFL